MINPITNKRVSVVARPYVLTFLGTGASYPLSSDEAERLIAEYPLLYASTNRVELQGSDQRTRITAATLGGGPAFIVEAVAPLSGLRRIPGSLRHA